MIELLKNWITSIVTFSMFVVILELLLPDGNIRKAVNLVSGFIMIIVVINPFIGLFNKDINLMDFQIVSSNFLDREDINYKSKMLDEIKMRQTIEVYRQKLMSQAESATRDISGVLDANADVIIDEDLSSEGFGSIKRIYLYIITGNERDGNSTIKIDKIKIGEKEDKVSDQNLEYDEKINSEIKDRISNLLDVDKQNIILSFEKE